MNLKDLVLNTYCKFKSFAQDKEGATAIEYAVIAGLIVAVVIGTLQILGPQIDGIFQSISNALPAAS